MIVGRVDFSRLLRIFVKTLLIKMHRLIGRKSEKDCGESFLEIRTI